MQSVILSWRRPQCTLGWKQVFKTTIPPPVARWLWWHQSWPLQAACLQGPRHTTLQSGYESLPTPLRTANLHCGLPRTRSARFCLPHMMLGGHLRRAKRKREEQLEDVETTSSLAGRKLTRRRPRNAPDSVCMALEHLLLVQLHCDSLASR